MTNPTHDQETFEAGLRIVSSAKARGVKAWVVWQMLRAALPEEYRSSEADIETMALQLEDRAKRLRDGQRQLNEGFCQDDFLSAGRGGVPTFRPGGD